MGTIDNGYLVLLYECGIITAMVVLVRYAKALWCSGRRALRIPHHLLLALALCGLLCAFLANNVLDRYPFGSGNPFSLLGIFFVVSSRADHEYTS